MQPGPLGTTTSSSLRTAAEGGGFTSGRTNINVLTARAKPASPRFSAPPGAPSTLPQGCDNFGPKYINKYRVNAMCLFVRIHQEVMYARACLFWLVSRSGTSWDGRSTIEEAPNPPAELQVLCTSIQALYNSRSYCRSGLHPRLQSNARLQLLLVPTLPLLCGGWVGRGAGNGSALLRLRQNGNYHYRNNLATSAHAPCQ